MFRVLSILTLLLTSLVTTNCCGNTSIRSLIQPKEFVKDVWNSQEVMDIQWANRPALARDLIRRKVLLGKSIQEVREMLGDSGADDTGVTVDLRYELEEIFECDIDPVAIENMVIFFNSDGKVKQVQIEYRRIK